MKNTILKIAGVKNPEDFYKKYATEADFLKAYPKFALGGKMNIKAMQQFAGGGRFFQNAGEGIGNYFKAVADTTLGTFGASNVIDNYSGYGANEMSNLNEKLQPMTSAIVPMAANIALPGSGAIVSAGQQAIGTMNPEDNTGLDENGNPKNPDAAKYQQAGQTVAQLGSIGAQIYGASKSPSTGGGIPNGGPIKRAMGGMQYAMGGMQQYPGGGNGEGNSQVEKQENSIAANGQFTQFNEPSHDAQNPNIPNASFGKGEKVFTDRFGPNGKKGPTFASLNKVNDTTKLEKKFDKLPKNTYTDNAKNSQKMGMLNSSDMLFAQQELLKQQMASSAFDRMVKKYGVPPQLKNAQPSQYNEQIPQGMPGQSQSEMAMVRHGGMMNYMAMGGIQESDYQTDPAKLPSLLRQQKANDATILGMRSSFGRNADTNNVEDPLVVTFNKAKNYGKELADKIKNHPDNKKIEPFAMGGKLPMYYMGGDNDPEPDQPYTGSNYKDFDMQETNYFPQENYVQPQSTFNPYSVESWKFQQQLNKDRALYGNSAERISNQYTPAQNWNAQGLAGKINPNAGSPSGNTQGNLGVQGPPKIEGKGFDYKKAAGNLGQFALQNAGNIYDLGRSTQDNSKLNLSRISPTFLDKTQDLQNNLRLYSEGKRQTAEASQGNASTYLSNMYANRASKLANDLNINTTYGNLNASIDNAAKLYNAGAIDKETMFKLQAEGMNRNLKGQALAGMSQNFLNQRNSDRQDALDQQRLGIQKDFYKEYWANQDRENQRKVDEITKGKSNKNSWLDCSSGNCVERTSDQTQSTQSNPYYFSERQNDWNKIANDQQVKEKMDKLKKGKK